MWFSRKSWFPILINLFLGLALLPWQARSQSSISGTQDTADGYWVVEAPMPIPLSNHAVIAYDGYIYVVGYNGSARFDPTSDSWTLLPPMFPIILDSDDACLGYNSQGEPIIALLPDFYTDLIMVYNIARNRWERRSVPDPLHPLWQPDIASDQEHNVCYITGGSESNSMYAYYPAANNAQELPSFTTAREDHASWFIPQWGEAGYVCVAGGWGVGYDAFSTQCYDVAQSVWRPENADMAPLPYRWSAMADALTVVDGAPRLWLLGGVLNAFNTNKVAYYNIGQGAWTDGPHLPYAVVDMEADVLSDEIYVVGGYYYEGSTAIVTNYNQHYIPESLPTCTDVPLFFDDFEGEQQWTSSGYYSLWHTELESDICGSLVAPFPSTGTAWYYGDEGHGCTYDTPEWYGNEGYLTLDATLPITGARYATVSFWSYEQTQCGDDLKCPYDLRFLDISYDGGASWTHLWRGITDSNWYTVTAATYVDPGDSLRLRFFFDSVDFVYNDYLGWFIDNVEVTGCFEQPTQTWFEEDDPAIAYTGPWKSLACPECSGGAQKAAAQRGATAEFTFTGTGIRWYMTKANLLGKARVVLDGVDLGFVDLFSPTPQYQQVWEKTDLSPGAHTLKIEVSGKKNPRSRGRAITLDALEVLP